MTAGTVGPMAGPLTLASNARWWGIFFCYLFLLFYLSSPTYAAASTCSQGVNTLIFFDVLN